MIQSFSLTDIGKKRKLNQDYVYACDEQIGSLPNVYMVADGMGGHKAGDYASKCAVETIIREIKGSYEKSPIRIFSKAIRTANAQIRRKAREDENLYGMGTTIVLATCIGKYLQVANVGDSRLYVIGDEIRQITRDHSLVEEMVRMGGIAREEARNHPDKNIITRAIGARDTIEIDFFHEELKSGDVVLMCSDGLTNMLLDEEIDSIVKSQDTPQKRAEKLIEAANENGGQDNIAVIIIQDNRG